MDGLKTGYTDKAGYCLTGTMKKNDMRLVSVVMGSKTKEDRNEDTIGMMEYGFSVYGIKFQEFCNFAEYLTTKHNLF